jgi:ABC-type transporter Mla MlaB component
MLKISIVNESRATICFQLEGSLIGPWVEELNRLSEAALADSKKVSLDLERLRFVDLDGAALLKSLAEREVAQLNCSPFIREHLERESQ